MHLGLQVNLTFHIGERDVDMVGMIRGLAEKRSAAAIAEAACSVVGGVEAGELVSAFGHLNLISVNAEPGDVCRAMVALALSAMTVSAEERWQFDSEADDAAKASAKYRGFAHGWGSSEFRRAWRSSLRRKWGRKSGPRSRPDDEFTGLVQFVS